MANKRKDLNITGPNLWYLVGLITADGCLSSDGRHIDITSKDRSLLTELKKQLGLINKIGVKNKDTYKQAYRIQITNRNFYEFLLSIGLTRNKSLTVGKIKIPNCFFEDFFRGVIDGDGCIRKWVHPSNNREQWSLRIYSGSEKFIEWLKNLAESLLGIQGKVYRESDGLCILKYGKMAAREIAKKCYYENCLGLDRKIKLANECIGSYKGWSKSNTVFN